MSEPYDIGDGVSLSTPLTTPGGALITGATVVVALTRPDGTTFTPAPTVTESPPGTYTTSVFVVDQANQWLAKWTATGPTTAVHWSTFLVRANPAYTDAPPLATADELRTYLQLSATDLPDDQARLVLAGVSGDIRREAGWSITQETGATFTRDAPYGPDVFLPTLHLTSVTSVVVDGTALSSVDYEWNEVGRLTRLAGVWWRRSIRQLANVVAVVNHGYPIGQVPNSVKSLCLEQAARRLGWPDGMPKAYRVDNYQETPVALPLSLTRIEDDPRVPRVPGVA